MPQWRLLIYCFDWPVRFCWFPRYSKLSSGCHLSSPLSSLLIYCTPIASSHDLRFFFFFLHRTQEKMTWRQDNKGNKKKFVGHFQLLIFLICHRPDNNGCFVCIRKTFQRLLCCKKKRKKRKCNVNKDKSVHSFIMPIYVSVVCTENAVLSADF